MGLIFPIKKKKELIRKFLAFIPKHSEIEEKTVDEFLQIVSMIENSNSKDMEKLVTYFNQEIQDLIDYNKETLEDQKAKLAIIEDSFVKIISKNDEVLMSEIIFTKEFEKYKFSLLAYSDVEIFIENLENLSENLFKILDEKIAFEDIKKQFRDTNFKLNYRRNEFSRDLQTVKYLLTKADIVDEEQRKVYIAKIVK